jgi:type I restriction enzyme S subunit
VELEYGKGLRKDTRDATGSVPVYGSNGIVGYHSVPLTTASSIIVGRKGAIGAVHLATVPCWPIDTTYYVFPPNGIDIGFLYYLLGNCSLGSLDKSTAIPGLNRDDVYRMSILFPPLPEQHRVVAKIEELFIRLDAGVEALTKTKAQLKRYRQSVLKHAFEGRLTEDWRHVHKDELEPASVLLERIKQERKKDAKRKYEELSPLDTSDLSQLPEGWAWARVGEIGLVETGNTPSKSQAAYYGRDYNFYKPTDLNAGYYTRESEDGLSSEGIKKARLLPERSILITCIGATIGKTGFIRQRGASNQQINAIIPDRIMLPEFLYFICISPQFQNGILSNASATTLPILSKRKFEVLELPLCPIFEQHQVVEEIERRFSVADEIEKTVDHSLKQAERLRQSILRRAFEGKLVPQDPNDEPAEKLLERIKAERTKHLAEAKAASKSKKNTPTKHMRFM